MLAREFSTHKSSLIAFLVLTVGIGWAIGSTNLPGEWYAGLNKPSFNPPNWLFAPVWTVLYVMIAVAGWRTFHSRGEQAAKVLWGTQMALNYAWSPIFFRAHSLIGALVIILALLAVIISFIGTRWHSDRLSSMLFLPYAMWVAFASLLNYEILRLAQHR